MGQSLYETYPAAQGRDGSLRGHPSRYLGAVLFPGTLEALTETVNTQPCMLAVELGAAAALEEMGVKADFAAGFSLGEIAALACAGAASVEDAFTLVCRRAELMQKAAEAVDSAMAAVLKLPNEQVEALAAPYEHVLAGEL